MAHLPKHQNVENFHFCFIYFIAGRSLREEVVLARSAVMFLVRCLPERECCHLPYITPDIRQPVCPLMDIPEEYGLSMDKLQPRQA